MTSQIGNISPNLPKGKQNATKTGTGQAMPGPSGPMTPDPTPEPDEARTNAELKRGQEAVSRVTEDDSAEFSITRHPHPDENPTDEEEKVFQEVLNSGSSEHRKILGVNEIYNNKYEEEQEVLDAFHNRGQKVHPKFSKHKDAEKAFQMILKAGAALGMDEEEIQNLKEWEGDEEGDEEVDGMYGVEHGVPVPHKKIVELYKQATPHFAQLQINPKSKVAAKELDNINDQIKKQNEKDELEPSDQWTIRYKDFAEIYQKARPAIDRVRKDNNDSEAKKTLEEHFKTLSEIIKPNHYLDWNINLDIAAPERPRARSKSPAPVNSTPEPPASAPTDSTPKSPAPTPADSTPKSPAPTPDSGSAAQQAPARLQAAQKIQLETLQLWANMGWSIHKMSDGDTILSHKPLSREGKEPHAYEFTVMTQDSPYFQIKLGSEIDRDEMDTYLALPKVYKIITDPGDKDKLVYTWREKSKYDRLLWTATKPRKQTQAGKTPRAGDTQCCVVWKDGTVSEMARAQFTKVTRENEKKAIEKYCKSVEIKAPWEMDPKTLTVSATSALGQQLLQAGRTGSAITFGSSALKVAASNAENPERVSSSVQSSLAALQISLQAIGSRFEQSQILMQQQMQQQQQMQSMMQQQMQQQREQQMTLTSTMAGILKMLESTSSNGSTSQVKIEPSA